MTFTEKTLARFQIQAFFGKIDGTDFDVIGSIET